MRSDRRTARTSGAIPAPRAAAGDGTEPRPNLRSRSAARSSAGSTTCGRPSSSAPNWAPRGRTRFRRPHLAAPDRRRPVPDPASRHPRAVRRRPPRLPCVEAARTALVPGRARWTGRGRARRSRPQRPGGRSSDRPWHRPAGLVRRRRSSRPPRRRHRISQDPRRPRRDQRIQDRPRRTSLFPGRVLPTSRDSVPHRFPAPVRVRTPVVRPTRSPARRRPGRARLTLPVRRPVRSPALRPPPSAAPLPAATRPGRWARPAAVPDASVPRPRSPVAPPLPRPTPSPVSPRLPGPRPRVRRSGVGRERRRRGGVPARSRPNPPGSSPRAGGRPSTRPTRAGAPVRSASRPPARPAVLLSRQRRQATRDPGRQWHAIAVPTRGAGRRWHRRHPSRRVPYRPPVRRPRRPVADVRPSPASRRGVTSRWLPAPAPPSRRPAVVAGAAAGRPRRRRRPPRTRRKARTRPTASSAVAGPRRRTRQTGPPAAGGPRRRQARPPAVVPNRRARPLGANALSAPPTGSGRPDGCRTPTRSCRSSKPAARRVPHRRRRSAPPAGDPHPASCPPLRTSHRRGRPGVAVPAPLCHPVTNRQVNGRPARAPPSPSTAPPVVATARRTTRRPTSRRPAAPWRHPARSTTHAVPGPAVPRSPAGRRPTNPPRRHPPPRHRAAPRPAPNRVRRFRLVGRLVPGLVRRSVRGRVRRFRLVGRPVPGPAPRPYPARTSRPARFVGRPVPARTAPPVVPPAPTGPRAQVRLRPDGPVRTVLVGHPAVRTIRAVPWPAALPPSGPTIGPPVAPCHHSGIRAVPNRPACHRFPPTRRSRP
ncbi:hypothetical protein SAMN05444858_11791 [Micromonospora avicenniae]|uniref:Uncharacterized protein n=1 Tax=Micromonospora avicenniae TaxID=1198245 RepID=A0A1N7DMI6_9ACTN|nr:hypothetical protein SAMN05444858_11791 [Micromonospora avicenniae]